MSTVLIVEDSLTQLDLIARCLQQAGLAVIVARSGEEAQEKLNSQKPDVIVLDVILPGQSGFELCREIKANPNTGSIPVVMCSTKGTEADRVWGNMLGADAYLAKPIDTQALVQTIRQFIR